MKVLGIDTATLAAGIAVIDDDRVLAEATHDASARSSGLLISIDDVCKRAGITPQGLDAVAIGAGPGSFTGLRIGMATAKGIAFAAGKPLWSVSSLAAMAFGAPSPVVAVLDARRGEVYAGCYRDGVLVGDERVMSPAELATWVESLVGPAHFVGDALAAHEILAPLRARWSPPSTPSGAAVARLALAGARIDVLTSGAPAYIRPSEAEIRYPDGVPGAVRRR